MTPSLSLCDARDGRPMNTIHRGQSLYCQMFLRVFAPNIYDIVFRKFRFSVRCPAALAFLIAAIFNVFELSANHQMRNSDAASIVADMHNDHSVWNLAVLQLPRESVSADQLAFDRKNTVPLALDVTSPQPAIAGFVDLLPETFFGRTGIMTVDVSNRAALDPAKTPSSVGRNWSKLTTTALAVSVFDFARGIVGGIVRMHVESPFDVPSPGMLMTSPGQPITYQYCTPLGHFLQSGVPA